MAKGDKLKDYIRKERGRGFDDHIIREKLLETGYRQQDVESAFADLPHPAVVTARPTRNYKTIAIIIGACVLLLLIGSLVLGGTKNCGADEQCFIDRANVCQPASLSQDVQGAVFDYSAKVEITPDCTLTKTVTALDPSEPEEMKALFNGASMTCQYEKGNFNPELVTTITRGLDQCDGDLKTAIYQVVLAVYQLQQEGQ